MNRLRRYHLKALHAVEAAGRLGSLSRAADELGVTVGAVSQHVRHVELQLGHVLFTRHPKGLEPTPTAGPLLAGLTRGFRAIEEALDSGAPRRGQGLVVTVAPVLAAKWLVPRLARFHAMRPDLPVRIDASPALADFDHGEADVGIRVGDGNWPRLRTKRLAEQTIFPVCSPAMAKNLRTVDDLSRVPIIRDHGARSLWDLWLSRTSGEGIILGSGPTYSDSALCLDAAISGQGVMLGWSTLAEQALKSGTLVEPFGLRVATGLAYWLVSSNRIPVSADARVFGAWIARELRDGVS